MTPSLSYVVLTRDRREELLGCLASLALQDLPDTEIVLVDGGSGDGTVEAVRHDFPAARIVEVGRNPGVAGGRNLGIAEARAPLCLLLDDDARLTEPDAARRVRGFFDRDPGLACLALRVLDAATGEDAPKSVPRADRRPPGDGEECAFFCGAGFAIRRETFLALGGFWEDLFYAGEEVDLSYRLLAAGHRLVYTRQASVLHREVPAARPSSRWVYHQSRNRCLVATRHLPLRFLATHVAAWTAFTGGVALRDRQLGAWARGMRDAARALPGVFRERQPLDAATVSKVRRLGGRLWY